VHVLRCLCHHVTAPLSVCTNFGAAAPVLLPLCFSLHRRHSPLQIVLRARPTYHHLVVDGRAGDSSTPTVPANSAARQISVFGSVILGALCGRTPIVHRASSFDSVFDVCSLCRPARFSRALRLRAKLRLGRVLQSRYLKRAAGNVPPASQPR